MDFRRWQDIVRSFNGSGCHAAAHGWFEGRRQLVPTRFRAAVPSAGRQPHLEPVIWCLGSDTWLKSPTPILAGVLITVRLYGKLEQMPCSNCFGQARFCIPDCHIWRLCCLSGTPACSLMMRLSGGSAWTCCFGEDPGGRQSFLRHTV